MSLRKTQKKSLSKSTPSSIFRYIFNTPPDAQRNLQSQFVLLNGTETIMFTSFSHETLCGLTSLIFALNDYHGRIKVMGKLKMYGTQKHWNYFEAAKFHLADKVFGLSYSTWMVPEHYRLGIVDEELRREIIKSDKFSNFVWRINWRVEKEPKEKVNNSQEFMQGKNEYYEDEYMIIRPFFQDNPDLDYNKQKASKMKGITWYHKQREIKDYLDSSTHFLCFSKVEDAEQNQESEEFKRPASLIITYRSVEQIQKILDRVDEVKHMKNQPCFLDFIQTNLNPESGPKSRLTHIVHIIQSPDIVLSQQFYLLFSKLDSFCYPSSSPATHLFYGFGIKSSTTDIHYLLNSYYKGIRFYSICGKLFRFVPNITQQHLKYWSTIFEKDFINVVDKIEEFKANQNGSFIEVYKPIHAVNVAGALEKNQNSQKILNSTNFYSVSAQFLAALQYPLFSNALDFRFTQQQSELYQSKIAFEKYSSSKPKGSKGANISRIKQFKQFDPKIIFLGTNSKTPNEFRNVSGILLELPHENSETLCILDCGAGTCDQFVYQYEPDVLQEKLLNLKIIFMTHLHADHNLGITDLIKKRNDLIKRRGLAIEENKLFVVLPFNTVGWFYNYCRNLSNVGEGCEILLTQTLTGEKISTIDEFYESKYCQVSNSRIKLSPGQLFKSQGQEEVDHTSEEYYQKYLKHLESYEDYLKSLPDNESNLMRTVLNFYGTGQEDVKKIFEELMKKVKLKRFMPYKVIHCPFSYGIVIEHNNGIKVSYSGDCRPSPEFLDQAKGSTLLIHEATFETNQQERAVKNFHSTACQAIQAYLFVNLDS